jgi:hypothetical protein
MLLLRLPDADDGGGLGDRDGCRDEFGVDTRDRAEVGVSERRFASSTYFGFVIDFRLTDNCCSSEAMALAVLERCRRPLIFVYFIYYRRLREILRQYTQKELSCVT